MNLTTLDPETSARACQVCGALVDDPTQVEEFEPEVVEFEMIRGSGWIEVKPTTATIELTRCPDCQAIRDQAKKLVDAHPAVLRRRGDAAYQLLLVESALIAIYSLGPTLAMFVKGLTGSDRDLAMLIDRMSSSGGYARFSTNLVPVMRLGFGSRVCSTTRWSHISDERKQIIARAYADLIEERVGPAQIPPPTDGLPGCLICGVGTIRSLRSRSAAAWGRLYEVEPSILGGHISPDNLAGHLCPDCRAEVERYGMGPTAMESSLFAMVGRARAEFHEDEWDWSVVRVVGWAALRPRPEPSEQRWAHVDIEGLRQTMAPVDPELRPLRITVRSASVRSSEAR